MQFSLLCVGVGGQGVVRASQILAWAALLDGYDVRGAETHGMAQRGGSVASYLRFGTDVHGALIPRGAVDALLALEASEALRFADYAGGSTVALVSTNQQVPPVVLTSRSVVVDEASCVGCGNCLAFCYPLHASRVRGNAGPGAYTYLPGDDLPVRNGRRGLVATCTGCGECVQQRACPRNALKLKADFSYPRFARIRAVLEMRAAAVLVVDAPTLAIEAGSARTANVTMLGALWGTGHLPLSRENLELSISRFVPAKARRVNERAFQLGLEAAQAAQAGAAPSGVSAKRELAGPAGAAGAAGKERSGGG